MAAKILSLKQRVGALKLIPSSGGVFEISVDGRKIYSKQQSGQFPEADTIMKEIKARL